LRFKISPKDPGVSGPDHYCGKKGIWASGRIEDTKKRPCTTTNANCKQKPFTKKQKTKVSRERSNIHKKEESKDTTEGRREAAKLQRKVSAKGGGGGIKERAD